MSTERTHHPYSPSSLQFREACPCYENRDVVNARAVAGTLAHAVTDTGQDDERLSDDDASNAAACMDFYERQKQLFIEERDREIKRLKAGQSDWLPGCPDGVAEVIELREVYLPIDFCKFEDGAPWRKADGSGLLLPPVIVESTTAGYLDRGLISWDRKRAHLFDWKFGAWPVEDADNNLQGMAYALGVWRKYPTLETIKFTFKQPLIDAVSEVTWHRNELPALYLRIQTVVARAREAKRLGDFSTARPMSPCCNFCGNLGKCPKVCEFACRVGAKFWPLDIPASITPTEVQDPKNIAIGLRLSAVLKVWCDAFRSSVTNRVIARPDMEIPPGYKLQSRADREIQDKQLFKSVALRYVTEQELDGAVTYTFGPIEEKISEKAPRMRKSATVEEFQKACEAAGAVKKGDPYYFLRAVAEKKKA